MTDKQLAFGLSVLLDNIQARKEIILKHPNDDIYKVIEEQFNAVEYLLEGEIEELKKGKTNE